MSSSVSLRPGLVSAGSRGARLLALVAVLVAALVLAVVPFPGLARAAAADAPAAVRQAPLEDDDSGVVAEESDDDGSVTDGEDDGSGLEEDDDLGDDLDDDLGDEEDVEEILPVVIDRGGRATSSPKAFVASRTVKGTKLRWKSWGSATTTGSGRLAFRTAGRKGKAVKGAGTVRLSRLLTCDDGTAVYRRATFAVPRRGRVVVTLPGCPAAR